MHTKSNHWIGWGIGFMLLVASGFAGISAKAASVLAGSNAASTAPHTSVPIQDCLAGCYIMTCAGTWCTVWYCDGQAGCVAIGRFPQQAAKLPAPAAQPLSARPGVAGTNDIVYVKTCGSMTRCSIYALAGSGASLVGSVDNVNGLVEAYDAHRRSQGPGQR